MVRFKVTFLVGFGIGANAMGDKKRFATKEASDTNRRKKDVTSKFKGKVFHFTTQFCSGTSYKALLFLTNTKCILFSVQIQHAMSFFIEVKFFPIHIRLRFATITLLIGCNLKNLGAIKKAFLCLYFSNGKVLSAGNKNVDAR